MKAAQLIKYGGKDSVVVSDEAAKPSPGEGQVLVEVHAASVNPFDWKLREGYMQERIPLNFPSTLGGDISGVVSEIAEGVTGFEVGQAVYGLAGSVSGNGSFAEFAPVTATSLAIKPSTIDFVTAAAFPLASVSAYQAVAELIDIQSGQKILIHGGAGGIGSIAIQIAKKLGAYVATTVSAKDKDFAAELGADEVIDYATQDFASLLQDYDGVLDTIGGETSEKSYQVLKPGGKIVSLAAPANEELAKEKSVEYIYLATQVTSERLNAITKLIEDGDLKLNIDKVFTLDEAAEALEYQKTGHARGKVAIKVKD